MAAGIERSEPPYLQIVAHFRELIASGELRPGDRLPTVRDLAAEWQVARQTADRAVATLRAEGLITTGGRNGTIVAAQDVDTLTISIEEPPGVTVTSAEVQRASQAVADELGVRPGSAVVVLRLGRESD